MIPDTLALRREYRAAARKTRVVVVGAGLGGLAIALRLLSAGMDVTVLEAAEGPGGSAGQILEEGFTFDTGPSLITMPGLIDELFQLADTSLDAQLRMHKLDPFYRIAWQGEDRSFRFNGAREEMVDEIGRFSMIDARRYDDFLRASQRIYEEAILVAGRQSFLRLADFLALLPRMIRLGALRSVHGFVSRFFAEPHVQQAFGFHSLFIGGDPFRVPAVYAALAYLQIQEGVWYAEGGVYALVTAMARLVAAGGDIVTRCAVREIVHDGRRVRGVRIEGGDVLDADYVVSNADIVATRRMLGRSSRGQHLTMSCYLLFLGCRRKFPQLTHHALLVGQNYRQFIRGVTRGTHLLDDLSLYVHAPSRTDAAMAIPGGESISVLLPVPNLADGKEWVRGTEDIRERVLKALESPDGLGLSGLRDSIVVEQERTPLDFRDRLGATDGHAFGLEPTLLQSAYFRQPNRDRHLSGLYYVGASVHPGAGIPGVLMTAEITAGLMRDEMLEQRG